MSKSPHILHLPKWYPNADDPQLGIFVQKQIIAVSHYCKQSVLYVKSETEMEEDYSIKCEKIDKILEVRICYRKSKNRSKQLIQLNKMYELGLKEIEKRRSLPSLIHVHNLITPAIWAHKYSNSHNIPWILSEHWSGYTQSSGVFSSKMIWEKKLWQWYSEKAACVISVSSFLKNALIENGIGKKHIVIPNVVEAKAKHSNREDEEKRMFFVGDMVDEVKNISGIVETFSSLSEKYDDLRLWLVGGGEDENKIRELAKKYDLGKKLKIFGRLENKEVLELYEEIDFTVINSRVETFSVVAAESLLAGKPVISTRCGGVEEFLDERTGYLIDVDNTNQLIEAIEKMYSRVDLFDPLALSKIAKKKFSSKAVGKALYEVYQSIIHD